MKETIWFVIQILMYLAFGFVFWLFVYFIGKLF